MTKVVEVLIGGRLYYILIFNGVRSGHSFALSVKLIVVQNSLLWPWRLNMKICEILKLEFGQYFTKKLARSKC